MPVVWITGLSGAGKSTLAAEVARLLRQERSDVVLLDGDALREVFAASGAPQGYGRGERLALGFQYAHLCRVLANQGLTVVMATISLFRELHVWNRANLPGYLEVFLDVPEAERRRRDVNGLYRRFDAGEVGDVAGLDLPVDEPAAPHLHLVFDPARTTTTAALDVVTALARLPGSH